MNKKLFLRAKKTVLAISCFIASTQMQAEPTIVSASYGYPTCRLTDVSVFPDAFSLVQGTSIVQQLNAPVSYQSFGPRIGGRIFGPVPDIAEGVGKILFITYKDGTVQRIPDGSKLVLTSGKNVTDIKTAKYGCDSIDVLLAVKSKVGSPVSSLLSVLTYDPAPGVEKWLILNVKDDSGVVYNVTLKERQGKIPTAQEAMQLAMDQKRADVELRKTGCTNSGGSWTGTECKCNAGSVLRYDTTIPANQGMLQECMLIAEKDCWATNGIWDGSSKCMCQKGFFVPGGQTKCVPIPACCYSGGDGAKCRTADGCRGVCLAGETQQYIGHHYACESENSRCSCSETASHCPGCPEGDRAPYNQTWAYDNDVAAQREAEFQKHCSKGGTHCYGDSECCSHSCNMILGICKW